MLYAAIILLSSCDKSIHGNIKDNFGVPIENIKISIPNSGYKTTTDIKGEFKLDYAAGEFDVVFEKEGYLPFDKSLKIAEHKQYPLGDMEIIRLPKGKGIYYIGDDDYLELPKIKLPSTKKTGYDFSIGYYTTYDYFFPKDTLGLILNVDTSATLTFLDNNPISTSLTKASDSRHLIKHAKSMTFSAAGSTRGIFINTKQERKASGIRIIKFKPTALNNNYSFVEISANDYGVESMSGNGFCFTLRCDTLQ